MSELINSYDNRTVIRRKFLTSASALVLTAYVSSAGVARAEDAASPQLWIEFGGQMDRVEGGNVAVTPPFAASVISNGLTPLAVSQRPALSAFGIEGKFEIRPEDSDWSFVASLRYGRASGNRRVHQQTAEPISNWKYPLVHDRYPSIPPYTQGAMHKFSDVVAHNRQSYAILDFDAGKDVGLGLFGKDGTSAVHAGVRIAQFTLRSSATIYADPDLYYVQKRSFKYPRYHHIYNATGFNDRNFRGVGPSLSWNASAELAGDKSVETLDFDWGVNAALLFGKQRAHGSHQTKGAFYYNPRLNVFHTTRTRYTNPPVNHDRKRSVVVPNIGGFAGLSVNFPNAKVSIGYRADLFLNAIDAGIDNRKEANRAFYGPFASISVGLGD